MIGKEKEVIDFLSLPSIPKKEWDKKQSFKNGVAVVNLVDGSQEYAIATFDTEKDNAPRIKKVFGITPYKSIESIFVVPSYMADDVANMDLSKESKEKATKIIEEAKELENEGTTTQTTTPKNEYCYDFIHNDEEAIAFIKDYNKRNGIKKGRIPNTHETIILRLTAIWMEENKNK